VLFFVSVFFLVKLLSFLFFLVLPSLILGFSLDFDVDVIYSLYITLLCSSKQGFSLFIYLWLQGPVICF